MPNHVDPSRGESIPAAFLLNFVKLPLAENCQTHLKKVNECEDWPESSHCFAIAQTLKLSTPFDDQSP
jgi:hypothetical protein